MFINQAQAAVAETTEVAAVAMQQSQTPGMMSQLVMLGGFVLVFWLLIWRPQSKRNKEHKQLLENLAKGDEVITAGGIVGKIVQVHADFTTLLVSDAIEMKFQKSSITSALPKGTIKSIG